MSDDVARASLLAVLADPAIGRINFNVGGVAITPQLFGRVAQAVRAGHIGVRHVSTLVNSGIYNSTENRFYLKRETLSTTTAQALVVHEACHAGLDVANASQMRTTTSEAVAYLSQCIYARAKTSTPDTTRLYADDTQRDRVFEVAWELAGVVLSGRTPPERDIERLRQAVLRHPEYASAGQGLAGYDGVPGM